LVKFNVEQFGVKVNYLKLDYPKCEPLKFLAQKFAV